MLKKTTKPDELVIQLDTISATYLQAQFEYSPEKTTVVCYDWSLTYQNGQSFPLNKMTYEQFEDVAYEITQLIDSHIESYGEILTEDYVAMKMAN